MSGCSTAPAIAAGYVVGGGTLQGKPLDPSLLAPAIRATQRVLARLEDDEVPPRLRQVAKRSGRLPPPLAASLLAELEQNPWLRERVAESLEEVDLEDANPRQAISLLYLRRPAGWEEQASQLTGSLRSAAAPAPAPGGGELRQARRRIAALTAKLERLQLERSELMSELAKTKSRAAQPRPSAPGRDSSARIVELESLVAALRRENSALEARLALLLKRRQRIMATPGRTAAGIPGQAMQLARQLDAQLASLAVPPLASPPPPLPAADGRPLEIPAGVAPDRAEAIDWLAAWKGDLVVALDGWNLAYFWKAPPGKRERNRVESALSRLGRRRGELGSGGSRLLVFFDSSVPSDAAPSRHPAVEVFFPESADNALIDLAQAGVVVISSDRRVREETEVKGAVALWSEAMAEWVERT